MILKIALQNTLSSSHILVCLKASTVAADLFVKSITSSSRKESESSFKQGVTYKCSIILSRLPISSFNPPNQIQNNLSE